MCLSDEELRPGGGEGACQKTRQRTGISEKKSTNESVLKQQRAWQEERGKRPVWLEQRDGDEIQEVGRGQRWSWGAPQVMVETCGEYIKTCVGV